MPMEIIPGPNFIVATPPAGDSSHRLADTEFVTLAIATFSTVIGTAIASAIASAIAAIPATTLPAFSVNKGGTAQLIADSVFTDLTWSTEVYDVGGFFSSNGWTPPAGTILLAAACAGTSAPSAKIAIGFTKDGALVGSAGYTINSGGDGSAALTIEDRTTGTAVYKVQAFLDVAAGSATIYGTTSVTFFMGHWISV